MKESTVYAFRRVGLVWMTELRRKRVAPYIPSGKSF
ncbi:hypothetical protein CSUI_004610 [Cystoisospora suis]|uniref:Uncharacterized protein n=1 Tax=Cystoisospora suis TaxID=483139 RepID=A0A2C6L0V8_9APIC|nr:hypothetical protein CSUI_004610 [Cystoisospora suis]